jgi:Fe-S cluster biogenesis protein NfuA
MSEPAEVARSLVRQFDQMVKRDGSTVELVGVDGGVVRVAYRPGVDPTCEDGACVMPHLELQDLMGETLARRDPDLSVVVELVVQD